jgi:predicted RNA-binding Zn ribbon-like protein
MRVITREFSAKDLVAGHPALDLVNTVTWRDTPTPIDWLDGYLRLLEWARLARIADDTTLVALAKLARTHAATATRALKRAKELREDIHTVYSALVSGTQVTRAALRRLEAAWKEAHSRMRLAQVGHRIEARSDVNLSRLDLIRDRLAVSAAPLLQHLPPGRARVCRGERCGWVFLDSSKGGQRVWCDMRVCGNAAKTRRHKTTRERRSSGRKA